MKNDPLLLGGREFTSRFILGSGKYSVALIDAAVKEAGAEIITLALRRAEAGEKDNIMEHIPETVTLLPNTSGARNADEAVRIARLSREVGYGSFITMKRLRLRRSLPKTALSSCPTCIPTYTPPGRSSRQGLQPLCP